MAKSIANWKLLVIFAPDIINMEERIFRLLLSTEADEFLLSLLEKVADKMRYNIRRVQKGERDPELFKKLGDTEIWEFRTLYNKMAYRLFSFWDTEKETLVIATHGIVKKTQKTPQKEIAKAQEFRRFYFANKKK